MKRFVALLLALGLCLGLLPGAALAATPFTDVPAGAYYEDAVEWAVANNITTGTSATTFGPDKTCTRAQAVTFLWRAEGSPEPVNTQMPFEDVPEGAYFYKAVLWALENEITTGTSATTFRPDNYCTRAQIVTFLWRTQGKPTVTAENPFEDVGADDYYTMPVLWAVANNITTGTSATTFRPDNYCTRAQIVTFLFRCMGEGAEDPDPDPEALAITQQPQDVACKVGEEVSFQVEVKGGQQPYTYQWQVRWDGDDAYVDITVDDSGTYTGWNEATLSFAASRADFDYHYAYRCVITDAAGNQVTSENAKLSEITPLTISQQPVNVTCESGETVQFHVAVEGGTEPYTYQWQYISDGFQEYQVFGDSDDWAAGYDTATLSIEVMPDDFFSHYKYRCVITDANGDTVTSDEACAIEAVSYPEITQQPEDAEGVVGGNISYTVAVSGGEAPYTYEWQYTYNGAGEYAALQSFNHWANGYDTDTLTLTVYEAFFNMNYQFRCVVTDAAGNQVISESASVNKLALTIVDQPTDVETSVSETAAFTVAAAGGTEPYTYEWQYTYDGAGEYAALQSFNHWASGYDTDTLTLTVYEAFFNMNYQFRCVVTDSDGNQVISESASVLKRALTIENQPADVTLNAGETAIFTVTAAGGTEPYSYQWQWTTPSWNGEYFDFNDDNAWVSGWDTADLSAQIEDFDFGLNYQFRCVVTDADGSIVVSDTATIIRYRDIYITSHPQNAAGNVGSSVRFSVAAAGGIGAHTYQWQYTSDDIAGWAILDETDTWAENMYTSELTVHVDQEMFDTNYLFRCVVRDANEIEAVSNYACILLPLQISQQPEDVAAYEGDWIRFNVAAKGGSGSYTYQWHAIVGDEDIALMESAYYNGTVSKELLVLVTDETFEQNPRFYCVVTDSAGATVQSDGAVVTEITPLYVVKEPEDMEVEIGESVSFTVEAAGGVAQIYYQWQSTSDLLSDYVDIPGANSQTLTMEMTEDNRTYNVKFRCFIMDDNGDYVISREVRPIFPLAVVKQPTNLNLDVGDLATFTVEVAGGTEPYTYQWYYLNTNSTGTPIAITDDSVFVGRQTNTLEFVVDSAHLNTYRFLCEITDANGASVSSSIVRVI